MRQVCPRCSTLSSENAIACAMCGASLLPAIRARLIEPGASPQETMPAPQPDEFTVNRSGNKLTITWGIGALRKASAVGYAVLSSLILLALCTTEYAGDYCAMSPVLLLLLGTFYWMTAMLANRTSLRLSDEEWVIRRGPVPVPYAVYYYDSERRIDPQQYEKVKAVKELPMFGWSWEAILLAFLGRVTYGLYAETPSGGRTELVARQTGHGPYLRLRPSQFCRWRSGPARGPGQ